MPASHKMIKSREQKQNRELGIGDEQGRIPSRVKAAEVMERNEWKRQRGELEGFNR